MIVFEGEENSTTLKLYELDGSSFNFVVLPDILILNVFELSQAKINMTINQYIDSSVLSNEPLQEASNHSFHFRCFLVQALKYDTLFVGIILGQE